MGTPLRLNFSIAGVCFIYSVPRYEVNAPYPREGLSVLPSRIRELATDKNRQGCPLIEEVPDIEEAPEKKTKSSKKADKE
jgi:hypothetical protein